MAEFDLTAARRAALSPMSGKVPIPEYLQDFTSGAVVWAVRGLTGPELRMVEQAGSPDWIQLVKAVGAMTAGRAPDAETAADVEYDLEAAKQLAIIEAGAVDPSLNREQAVFLADNFPAVAKVLREKISNLTGEGPRPGESTRSTPEPT